MQVKLIQLFLLFIPNLLNSNYFSSLIVKTYVHTRTADDFRSSFFRFLPQCYFGAKTFPQLLGLYYMACEECEF